MRMRSLKSVAWIPVVIVLVGCDQEHVQLPAPIRPVRYVIAQPSSGVRERIFTGAAKAGIESNLSFKVRGTIQKLGLKVGDRVRKNQLIAEIDPRDYELAVQQTEASLAQAKAQAARAAADFKRMRRLFERDNASQADFDSARAAQDSARALVRAIEKQIELAKLQVSYTRLVSPIHGKVAEVPVEVNENVKVGQTIVVLHAGARPEVEVAMPEVLIREIRQGAAVSVALDSLPNRSFSGRVSEVGVAATEGLMTYPVTILLDRSDARILPEWQPKSLSGLESRALFNAMSFLLMPFWRIGRAALSLWLAPRSRNWVWRSDGVLWWERWLRVESKLSRVSQTATES